MPKQVNQQENFMAGKQKDAPTSVPETDEEARKAKMLKAGIGIGIGSAAIVAALLYANSSRKKKTGNLVPPETD
jgi:hypothetical protein